MPNLKSAKKRTRIIEAKTKVNTVRKTNYKTSVKKFEKAIEEEKIDDAKTLFVDAQKSLDKAHATGILKKNTLSRKKANLSKKLNSLNK